MDVDDVNRSGTPILPADIIESRLGARVCMDAADQHALRGHSGSLGDPRAHRSA